MVAPSRAQFRSDAATRVALGHGRCQARTVVPGGAYARIESWPSRAAYAEAINATVRESWREVASADSATRHALRHGQPSSALDLGFCGRGTRVVTDHVRGCARIVVPAGAYARIPPWPSRALYLDGLEAAVRGPWRDALRRTPKDATSPDTFMRWARREAAGADSATGRGMRESVQRVARDLGCSEALVRRCRRVGRDLGIYRDIVAGRLLRLSERLEVHEHGSKQRGVTGERAWCVPAALRPFLTQISRARHVSPVNSATHPPRGEGSKKSSSRNPRPRPRTRGKNGKKAKVGRFAARSSTRTDAPGERLAREYIQHLPYGFRIAPHRVAPLFREFEAHGWPAAELLAVSDRTMRYLGWTHPKSVKSPGGYLHWLFTFIDATTYEPVPDRPDWCGTCSDPVKRQLELDDGRMQRCPRCHPLVIGRAD